MIYILWTKFIKFINNKKINFIYKIIQYCPFLSKNIYIIFFF